MDGQRFLEQHLRELQDPSMPPEKALELLRSPFWSHEAYSKGDNEPVVIFIAYMNFIITKIPKGCVDGIWDDILRKTLMYTITFSHRIHGMGLKYLRLSIWLNKSLSTPSMCPNPYTRLELFRLIRKVQINSDSMNWECLCITFIQTICEIKPHHLYPSGNEDDMLFDITDLSNIISNFDYEEFRYNLSVYFHTQDHNTNVKTVNSKETFISHCIQLVGVFAVRISRNKDSLQQLNELDRCCNFLTSEIDFFIYDFSDVVSRQPFRRFVVETVRDLSAAIINNKHPWTEWTLVNRGDVVRDLRVCTKSCILPRLLLHSQIQGSSSLVSQHALLLTKLWPYSLAKISLEPESDPE
ncbi:unnamed protein product [Meganyctiphanes norvegica]|uniref:Uncharacterized protein n=1 Tax=Meganyctiphanes norvegica TaxID=48144 RepID=A0AAV2S417_MEGNR